MGHQSLKTLQCSENIKDIGVEAVVLVSMQSHLKDEGLSTIKPSQSVGGAPPVGRV